MAAAFTMLFFFLHIFTASALESASEQVLPDAHPHLTGCVSANMETFRCRWNVGTSQSLSEPGALRLFYINKKSPHAPPKEWSECPHYSTDRPNECYFNENHTSIWTPYLVQLSSRDQAILYDENSFNVQDIVQPDPPFGVNWTLLNVSLTGTHYDIIVNWKPPQSADVEMGWMRLQYEVQYREVNSDLWEALDLVTSTHRSIFGLQTNVNHEVRVRCKMLGGKEFGEFSDSVFVHVPSKVSRFPVVALLIFGALCLVTILMLVIISQQEKLMVILLPPVPGPKIRGIDPELLKVFIYMLLCLTMTCPSTLCIEVNLHLKDQTHQTNVRELEGPRRVASRRSVSDKKLHLNTPNITLHTSRQWSSVIDIQKGKPGDRLDASHTVSTLSTQSSDERAKHIYSALVSNIKNHQETANVTGTGLQHQYTVV